MTLLIAGLILFLGAHSVRIIADAQREDIIARIGPMKWKGLITLFSIAGFALLIAGYESARTTPITLWEPPVWGRHLAVLLNLFAFILLVAAYIPRNSIKTKIGHPMVVAVKIWAFAHLLANGTLTDLVLFGGFLIWAVLNFRTSRRRDRAAAVVRASGALANNILTVAVGVVAWAVFLLWGHAWVVGVAPLAIG